MATDNKPASKRWSFVFWFLSIFCFAAFPLFLLDVGLDNYINTRNKIEENEAYRKLEIELERLIQYGDSRHYYHALLKKVFDFADAHEDPIAYLKRALSHLKTRNPGVFNFIVWDNQKGSIVEELTDEKGHKYILNVLYEVFRTVADDCLKNYPGSPDHNETVAKRINIIRSYIGNFLVAECLNIPFLRANLGEIIPVSVKNQKAYFWYQSGKKVTIMANVSGDAVNSYDYIDKLVKGINKSSKNGIKFGTIDLLHNTSNIPETEEGPTGELSVGVAKYENFSRPKLSTDNYLMMVKIMNPFVRAFCYIEKAHVYKNRNIKRNALIVAFVMMVVFLAGLWGMYRFTERNFSMRWKLALMFLYANGLPLLVLGFIGYDYMQQYKNLLLDEAYESISQLINDFDSKFEIIQKDYANRFNAYVDQLSICNKDEKASRKIFDKIIKEANSTYCKDFAIINYDGEFILNGQKALDNSLLKGMARNLIEYYNNKIYTPLSKFADSKTGGIDSFTRSGIFFYKILQRTRRIHYEHFLGSTNYCYWAFVLNPETQKFENLVSAMWSVELLQEMYVSEYIKQLNSNNQNIYCVVYSGSYGKVFPDRVVADSSLFSRFRQILNLTSVNYDEITYNNKKYAAYGSVGKQLNKMAFLGFYPLNIINQKTNDLWIKIILFIIASLMLTLGISRLLAAHFLAPLKDLQGGIVAMGRQDFRHRLPVKSADEFGKLSEVFNSALESLEDLAVATTVQENLFPLEPIEQNKTVIWGKSVTMTRLGGDYFDFFPLSENECGVLMGDVAGHGVPAGFLMAMAKAAVILSGDGRFTPSKLLSSIHKVFHHVKNKKIKRMMTCIYFNFNTETGAYKFANAGHCYPAIIDKDHKVSYIEIDGTPLGITKRARYVDNDGVLEPGNYMLLYTDGMIEAHNGAGESLGMERLTKLISDSYSENPEEYYNNIFAGYKAWAALADDDITMVLIKYAFGESAVVSSTAISEVSDHE